MNIANDMYFIVLCNIDTRGFSKLKSLNKQLNRHYKSYNIFKYYINNSIFTKNISYRKHNNSNYQEEETIIRIIKKGEILFFQRICRLDNINNPYKEYKTYTVNINKKIPSIIKIINDI